MDEAAAAPIKRRGGGKGETTRHQTMTMTTDTTHKNHIDHSGGRMKTVAVAATVTTTKMMRPRQNMEEVGGIMHNNRGLCRQQPHQDQHCCLPLMILPTFVFRGIFTSLSLRRWCLLLCQTNCKPSNTDIISTTIQLWSFFAWGGYQITMNISFHQKLEVTRNNTSMGVHTSKKVQRDDLP